MYLCFQTYSPVPMVELCNHYCQRLCSFGMTMLFHLLSLTTYPAEVSYENVNLYLLRNDLVSCTPSFHTSFCSWQMRVYNGPQHELWLHKKAFSPPPTAYMNPLTWHSGRAPPQDLLQTHS